MFTDLRSSELCFCKKALDTSKIDLWFTTKYRQSGKNWDGNIISAGEPYTPAVMFYSGKVLKRVNSDDWLENGKPAWRVFRIQVQRHIDSYGPTILLPYEKWNYENDSLITTSFPESVHDINRLKYTPWLRMRSHCIYAGTTFTGVHNEFILSRGIEVTGVYEETEITTEVEGYENS